MERKFSGIIILLLFAGCGTLNHSLEYGPGHSKLETYPFKVEGIENKSLADIPFDYAAYFEDALKKELDKKSLHLSGKASDKNYSLKAEVLNYVPGNAFKRWLVPGYGTTTLDLRVYAYETLNSEPIATIEVNRNISFGGAYTIGAYKTVFRDAAKAVVKEITAHINQKPGVVKI